jgi:1-acyl-sn-glycerol-3-phosphate acyltransferase
VGARGLGFWQRFAVGVIKPVMSGWTRRDWRGQENIPATGGVIIAANHPSEMDPFAMAHFIYESGRWPQYLAKASVFTIPVVGPILRSCKQIPVHRGTKDAAKSLVEAATAVRNGELVIIYPEGTTPKDGDFWPMRGKTGVARLWLETGVPVVPVLSWGPHLIFDPRDGHRKLHFRRTPVTLAAGPPVNLDKWVGAEPTTANLQAITGEIMGTLRDMMAEIRGEQPPAEPAEPPVLPPDQPARPAGRRRGPEADR